MPIRLNQLQASLGKGLAPVYLFGGPEPLLIQECRDAVFAAAREQGFTEREILYADARYDWDSLADSGMAPSLFASKRIVDLRLPTGKPGTAGSRALSNWLEAPDPDLLLVISCDQWDASSRKSKWATAIDRAAVRVDIWPITARDMPGWISERMKARGLAPERAAVLQLAQRLEGNLLAAHQEIEKLALLKGEGTVSEQDVLESVADSSRFDAFVLAEQLLAGRLGEALRAATGLRRTGVPIQMVTGALTRELRSLESFQLALDNGRNEAETFRKLNIWRSRQPLYRQAAGRLPHNTLLSALSHLSRIDLQSKGQAQGNPWHGLDHLVRSLCSASP
ncbi:MAG: DNA polymerase III subunit delta [Xanthomonadales bacterium]|nr:DNA polymerase III subunit delta [Xanthomonadales bacterium]